jgi:hypothetical protein
MIINCPHCGNGISPAAILGKEGGKKSRRKITPEQQAMMQAAKKAKKQEAE